MKGLMDTASPDTSLANAVRPSLGECLKAARRARGLTLKDVAARTGMAMSTLSKVENHQMSLTYDKLLQLSAGLGMEIAELFHTATGAESPSYTARRSLSRVGEGQLVRTKSYSYLYQCTDLLGKRMVPIMADLHARSLEEFGPLMRHAGEEYFLVTQGRVAVHTEFYAPEILEIGDGIYIDSNMGHAYLNAGEGPARAICVCSAEARDLYEQLRGLAEGRERTR
jgi:transcriptional regulator with XRE-family HTH domain